MSSTVSVCCQAHPPPINEGERKGYLAAPHSATQFFKNLAKKSPVVCQDTCLPKACKYKFYCLGDLILFTVLS